MRKNYAKMLSLPPYISTAWENVYSLQMDHINGILIVILTNEMKIAVPNLTGPVIEEIFHGHAEYLEHQAVHTQPTLMQPASTFTIGLGPQGIGIEGIEGFSGFLQHDPSQGDAPPIPPELLDKIAHVAGGLGVSLESFNLSLGEPHCNCPYCQITKAIQSQSIKLEVLPDVPEINNEALKGEPVSPSELVFREWDIEQLGDELYKVSNPLDANEQYQVFLGNPVGCTCGSSHCAHIVAVLQT